MTQTMLNREFWPSTQTDEASQRQRDRLAAVTSLQPIAPAVPGDRLPSIGIVGVGTYTGGTLTGPFNLTGMSSAQVSKAVTFDGSGVIRGVRFNEAVTVSATSALVFNDCWFYKPITVLSGGKVVVQGSVFDGTSAILNAGVVADAGSVGNYKPSATAHTNTTVVFEV